MERKFILIVLIITFCPILAFSQSYAEDTVWTRKTDQSAGMFQVKFSNNDSIIWAMGLENSLFFNAITGEEIHRMQGNNEVFFLSNDQFFIRLNNDRTAFEIFDLRTFQLIETLESDSIAVIEYPKCDISDNEHFLVAPIPKGFRIWNLDTKKIYKTKIFPDEHNLLNVGIAKTDFICSSNNIVAQVSKTYYNPNEPNHPITIGNFLVYDFFTLDSIDYYHNNRGFVLSNSCQYISYGTADPDFGVEVYDFNTKELLWKIPINGPSLTGIEFSPDDKYLVTSNGPGANCMKIWDMGTGEEAYGYSLTSFDNIALSKSGNYLVFTVGKGIRKIITHFNDIKVGEENDEPILIYPNPTNGIVNIEITNPVTELTEIALRDINGTSIRILNSELIQSGQQSLSFDLSDLSDGTYFIQISNSNLSLTYKLIKTK